MKKTEKNGLEKIDARIASGEIIEQKCWKMIRELNSYSEERLNSTALVNGERSFTYRQMFRQWERYAEVFSALGITHKNKSRVGIAAGAVIETVNAFYALNMMGVSVSMLDMLFTNDDGKCRSSIEKEGITDLIITDEFINVSVIERFVKKKEECGIRNVIYIHPPVCGPISTQAMRNADEFAFQQIKRVNGLLFMDELLEKYDAFPIAYGSGKQDEAAVIVHTSGTTGGIPKPVPLSDRGLNEAAVRILKLDEYSSMRGRVILPLIMPPAASYSTVDCIHLPLTFGGTIVSIAKFHLNPLSFRAIEHYGINTLFMPAMLLDIMMNMAARPNFSSVELAIIGGFYVSPEKKKRFDEFMKQCGSKAKLTVGYGLSEVGAACFLAPADNESASIGFPLPGIKVRLYSEAEDKYYTLEDGQHSGVLFVSTPSLSGGRIDDTVFFTLDEIDGEKYFNTNDVVKVNEDGSLAFVGRANRFFVNNDGVRFDAGLVETAFAAQPGISACGLVPDYSKTLHDTVPVLYVQLSDDSGLDVQTVRTALINVFIRDNNFEKSNLPAQCVICRKLPTNANGKVDVCRIRDEGQPGKKYKIEPVHWDDKLFDIILKPVNDAIRFGSAGEIDPFGTPVEVNNFFSLDGIVNGILSPKQTQDNGGFQLFPCFSRKKRAEGEQSRPSDPVNCFAEMMKNGMNGYGACGWQPPQMPPMSGNIRSFFGQNGEYCPPFFGQYGRNCPPFFGQKKEDDAEAGDPKKQELPKFSPPSYGQAPYTSPVQIISVLSGPFFTMMRQFAGMIRFFHSFLDNGMCGNKR